jgi:hypothetical protein
LPTTPPDRSQTFFLSHIEKRLFISGGFVMLGCRLWNHTNNATDSEIETRVAALFTETWQKMFQVGEDVTSK